MSAETAKADTPDCYYTPRDIAGLLQVPERTVRHLLINRKMCRFARIGRVIRVDRREFQEWMEARKTDSQCTEELWRR